MKVFILCVITTGIAALGSYIYKRSNRRPKDIVVATFDMSAYDKLDWQITQPTWIFSVQDDVIYITDIDEIK